MAHRQYTVASTAQLVGVPTAEERYFNGIKAMDHANREQSPLKRKTPVKEGGPAAPTPLRTNSEEEASSGTEVFTHSRHASASSSSPTTAIPESLPVETFRADSPILLLQPVAYKPPVAESETGTESVKTSDSQIPVEDQVMEKEVQMSPATTQHSNGENSTDLRIDPESSHSRSPSNGSTSSRRRGRRSSTLEIFFTPTDVTKSKIFLSSPQNSPTLPDGDGDGIEDDTASTPRGNSRPQSEIYVGSGPRFGTPARDNKLKITPEQLDQLVTALTKARMIQKEVRKHWWDVDDIPDDETMSSFSAVSMPTLTSASTLYSQAQLSLYSSDKDNITSQNRLSKEKKDSLEKSSTPIDAPFGGIALADPKIHGSPIRYVSKDYRIGATVLSVGACSLVQVPYGVDVECSLRIEPRSSHNTTVRVLFQCVNQVVDRKTGKKVQLLVADEDVTETFQKAALAELATSTGRRTSVVPPPSAPSPFQSPEIDWIAVADELQITAETTALVETTCQHFNSLNLETCHMSIATLLSHLETIKDQHSDFLILKPTAFHSNGIPQSMRLPWVSQRLYQDWYEKGDGVGHSAAAREFQEGIVAAVARGAVKGEGFTMSVKWDGEGVVVRCVPLSEGRGEGKGDLWACFVRGMFDV